MAWLMLLSLCFIQVWYSSMGNFVLDFTLSSVTTTGSYTCTPQCRMDLTFCLRGRRQGESTDVNDCPLGTKSLNTKYPLQSSKNKSIELKGSWPEYGRIQMFIDVNIKERYYTYREANHLDNIFINRALQVSNVFTEVAEYTGHSNSVTILIRFRVRCQDHYYGADCNTFCSEQDDDVKGHYTCNSDGSFQCREGFEYDSGSQFKSVCIDCKLGFVKKESRCIPSLPTDNSILSTNGLVTASGNHSNEADQRSGNDVMTGAVTSAVVVIILLFLFGVITTIIVVLVIVIVKFKRRKHYEHQGDQTLTSMKSTGMIVSTEKMSVNPMYNSPQFIASSKSCLGSITPHVQQIEHVSSDSAIYATVHAVERGTLRFVNNPVYGDSTYVSNHYDKIQYTKTDSTDNTNSMAMVSEEPLYIFPQPLDTETRISMGEKSTPEREGLTFVKGWPGQMTPSNFTHMPLQTFQ